VNLLKEIRDNNEYLLFVDSKFAIFKSNENMKFCTDLRLNIVDRSLIKYILESINKLESSEVNAIFDNLETN